MNTYSIYILATGMFTGRTISCDLSHIDINTSSDNGVVCGMYDHLSQKVDLQTGLVVDYIPQQPSINHVWNADKKRWYYVETDADVATKIRRTRDEIIARSDWTQGNDSPLGAEVKTAWSVYRQALRDITKQVGFPRSVAWPTSPT